MNNTRWSESYRHYAGRKPGQALVKWLNEPSGSTHFIFIESLLADARLVCEWLGKYKTLRDLNTARKQKKVPPEFWDAHIRVNETLAKFKHAPQIDLADIDGGERLSWMLVEDQPPTGLVGVQLRCILQLIDQNAVLKVRRCAFAECAKWYFARRSDQEFCSGSCRWKAFAGTEAFKKKRQAYARRIYLLKKSKNVK